jgi:hypothetical protein
MTVAAETNLITAIANGSQTVFPYTFRVLSSADILVVGKLASGVETYYTLGTHYTISGVGSYSGGNVTFLTAPADQTQITIRRVVSSFTQNTDLRNQGAFFAEVHEDAFDALTMQTQTLKTDVARALKLRNSEAAAGISTEVPAPESLKVIGWNQAATGLQNIDIADLAAIPAFISWTADLFSGDGATQIFSLTGNPAFAENLDVSINGLTKGNGFDFTFAVTAGIAQIVFFSPPANGAQIYVRYGQALPATEWPDHASTHFSGGSDPLTPSDIGAAPQYLSVSTNSGTTQISGNNRLWQFTNSTPAVAQLPASTAVGAQVAIQRAGTGSLSIAGGVGVTIQAPGGRVTLAQQHSIAVAVLAAVNTWVVSGDLV